MDYGSVSKTSVPQATYVAIRAQGDIHAEGLLASKISLLDWLVLLS